MSITKEKIDEIGLILVDTLKTKYGPELPVDIDELGLIYDAYVNEEGVVKVLMTLTNPNCPVAETMPTWVNDALLQIDDVTDAEVELTFDPPWDRDMMSEEAKFELGFL